jgi:two-component system sensor histidine kinase HydH
MMAIGQVAAGVAHELRNPLTSIKGLVQVNLREATKRSLPADDLAVIEHEIRRMERTLQTFLDFARPPVIQPVNPVVAEADQDQLQQLLLNLVLNSLDALPQGGTVEIELRSARDNFVELYVRDSGPGIAPHILPKVFETFVSSKETGVGLGLPLSRRLAEEQGGTLTGYNLPEGGACFVLRLPVPAQHKSG